MTGTFMISAKFAIPELPKMKIFWNENYDVITFAHGVNKKISFRDSNYVVDVDIWPKFGNTHFY